MKFVGKFAVMAVNELNGDKDNLTIGAECTCFCWCVRYNGTIGYVVEEITVGSCCRCSTTGVLVPYTRSGGSKQSFSTKNFAKIICDRHPMQKNRLCLIRE